MSLQHPLLENVSDEELGSRDIRVALFDIDGTLLGLEGKYSDATKREIQRIQNLGIKTAVASGRPYFAAKYIVQELGLDDAGSYCSGALVHEPKSENTLAISCIDHSDSLPLLDFLRKSNYHYELYTEDNYFIERNQRPNITDLHAEHLRLEATEKDFDSLIADRNIIKYIIAVDSFAEQEGLKLLADKFPQFQFTFASVAAHPEWLFANVVDKNASRQVAFASLLNFYQVSADQVVSFGDAQSDMVFLSSAGFGIAMGNANDEVKQCANFVTKPVWDDGVAYALQRLIS